METPHPARRLPFWRNTSSSSQGSRAWSRRAALLGTLGILGLIAASSCVPVRYAFRVLAYQDSDFSDIDRFPARRIEASETPSELRISLDPRVPDILEEHPEIGDFEAFLEKTETSAFLVFHRGRLVEERYLRGHDRSSYQNSFSVSKSVASALIGLAARDGLLRLTDPITRFLPELAERDETFSAVTVGDLLDMRSGIRYSSDTDFPFLDADDALIYYHPDLESVVLERTSIEGPPGAFEYNNYNPPLLGLILRRVTGQPVSEYLEEALWHPLGAEGAAGWTTDDRGLERMESGFHARARDLVRFGRLYLEGGEVDGTAVLPADWVATSTETPEPLEVDPADGRTWGYRMGWWIVPRSGGRSDFVAIGRYGQLIYVSPRHGTVFVRTGPGRGDWGDRDWTSLFHRAAERLDEELSGSSATMAVMGSAARGDDDG